ncbi:MAG: oligosaccharide flippase family protein [Solirubrobacteraceae bacterium]
MSSEPDVLDSFEAGPAALRGGALRSGGYALGLLLSLAAAPLLVRHLGQVGFGRYVAVISIATVVTGFTEAGLNAIAVREYSSLQGAERDRVLANALGLRIALSGLGVLIATAFAALAGYSGELVLGTALTSFGLMLASVQLMLGVALQGTLRFGLATLTDLVRQLVTVALLVGLVLAGADIVKFLAVPIVAGAVGVLLTAWFVRGMLPLRPSFSLAASLPMIRDTIPYAIAIALNAAYFRVAIVIMSLTATGLQTGYFSTSFRVIEVLIGVPALIIGAAFPILTRAVRDDKARFAAGAERLFELAVLAGTLVAVGVGLGAGFAVSLLGGEEAQPAADVLRIQGVAMIASFVAVACGFSLLSLRQNRALLIANAVAFATSIVLTLALVPAFEAKGAAAAAVSAELALAVALAVLLKRADAQLRLPFSVVPVAALGAAAAVGVALLVGGPEVLRAVIGSVVFVGVVGALGRFPPEFRHALRRGRDH